MQTCYIKRISLLSRYFCNKYPIYILCFQFSVSYTVKKLWKKILTEPKTKSFYHITKKKKKIDNWNVLLWFINLPKSFKYDLDYWNVILWFISLPKYFRYYLHLFSQRFLISQIIFHIIWVRILLYCLKQIFSLNK